MGYTHTQSIHVCMLFLVYTSNIYTKCPYVYVATRHTVQYLCLDKLLKGNGVLWLKLLLFFELSLEDKPGREGVAVDTLFSARTLPEPTIDSLLNGMEKVLTHL